jgi:radical SAM superfamily enzyme YgiQ (UPF0313 family)
MQTRWAKRKRSKMGNLIYRPPFEADSLLVEATCGCSHNCCSFCTMYKDVPFRVLPESQVEDQLRLAAEIRPEADRVFLENGDAFVLGADRLSQIAEAIHRILPRVSTIAMYASVLNIRTKSDEELRELRSFGINELNIGVESGLDEALRRMNKGYTAEEAEYELHRLRNAGIDYSANLILGLAGAGLWRENAEATAELMNKTNPYLIFTGTVHTEPGCRLYDEIENGAFVENTIGGYLDEEECLLHHLTLDYSFFFGLHPSNLVRMQGYLQRDKERFLAELSACRNRHSAELDKKPVRGQEGAILGE